MDACVLYVLNLELAVLPQSDILKVANEVGALAVCIYNRNMKIKWRLFLFDERIFLKINLFFGIWNMLDEAFEEELIFLLTELRAFKSVVF